MRCGLARCPGAKSTGFSIIPVVPFSHVHAISSRLQCNTADLPSGCCVPTLSTQYAGYQRKQSTCTRTSKDSGPFFWVVGCRDGLGDDVEFHCIDCRLISGSYVNTQVSSYIIIEFNKSAPFSMRCKISKLNSLRRSFWSSDSSLNHFCTNHSHVQFFPKNSSNTFPVQIESLSYRSNTQPSVF